MLRDHDKCSKKTYYKDLSLLDEHLTLFNIASMCDKEDTF